MVKQWFKPIDGKTVKELRKENAIRIGKEAEQVFLSCPNLFLRTKVMWATEDTTGEWIEGKDGAPFHAFSLLAHESCYENNNLLSVREVNGNVEIKGVNDFIRHDMEYNHMELSGTIPFEIFHTWKSTAYFGSALTMYNVEQFNEEKRINNRPETGVEPGTLVFILFDGYVEGTEKPFACITFEDIPKLRDRLRKILPAEWNLDRWNMPKLYNREYWRRYINFDNHGLCANWDSENGGMIQNCWHVPFRRLADLATVTRIDQDPSISAYRQTDYNMHESRLKYIKQQAYDLKTDIAGSKYWESRKVTDAEIEGYKRAQKNAMIFISFMKMKGRLETESIHTPDFITHIAVDIGGISTAEYRTKQLQCASGYTTRHKAS